MSRQPWICHIRKHKKFWPLIYLFLCHLKLASEVYEPGEAESSIFWWLQQTLSTELIDIIALWKSYEIKICPRSKLIHWSIQIQRALFKTRDICLINILRSIWNIFKLKWPSSAPSAQTLMAHLQSDLKFTDRTLLVKVTIHYFFRF